MLPTEAERLLCAYDLEVAEARLRSLERAPREGRWAGGDTEYLDACANAQARIDFLMVRLGELRLLEALGEELA